MKRALLLNSDYTPLHFITDQNAIEHVYKGSAEVVSGMNGNPSNWDEVWCSPSTFIHVPATLRLVKYANKKWKKPRFRKKVLFNRDNWECQYCGQKLYWNNITVEHIFPSSRGGETTWQNCVAACKSCNRKKANKTPEEAGMKLLSRPGIPQQMHFWDAFNSSVWHEDWDPYIGRP